MFPRIKNVCDSNCGKTLLTTVDSKQVPLVTRTVQCMLSPNECEKENGEETAVDYNAE